MIKKRIEEDLKKAALKLGFKVTDAEVYIPQNPKFGDYSTNMALQLSNQLSAISYQSSEEIANKIVETMWSFDFAQDNFSEIKVVGGFINFFIKEETLMKEVGEILKLGTNFGKTDLGKGKKIQVEFISANPTGPLTLPSGRGGAIGDSLANVLSFAGFDVEREYYLNDTGNQVRTLGESVLASLGKVPKRQEHYQGEYIKELASQASPGEAKDALELGEVVADYLMEHEIKPILKKFGINFDEFFSERSIYQKGLIEKTLEILEKRGVTYEKEGAVWLKTTEFGDEKDRVLLTSTEKRGRVEPTYLLPDIAYHLSVLKEGFDKKIDVWGADHHGYVARLKAGVAAAGYPDRVDIILMQMVKLIKGGQEVRMSKRTGTYVTLDELLDSVGKDAARFFLLMYSPDSPINFDLDLAKEKSNKNPVYYVQYAHARMSNILGKVEGLEGLEGLGELEGLEKKQELDLIKHIISFPDLVEEIAKSYQVHRLTTYAMNLADLFHKFYEVSPVLQAETEELKQARISLVKASIIVLGNTLGLLGISAPERM